MKRKFLYFIAFIFFQAENLEKNKYFEGFYRELPKKKFIEIVGKEIYVEDSFFVEDIFKNYVWKLRKWYNLVFFTLFLICLNIIFIKFNKPFRIFIYNKFYLRINEELFKQFISVLNFIFHIINANNIIIWLFHTKLFNPTKDAENEAEKLFDELEKSKSL